MDSDNYCIVTIHIKNLFGSKDIITVCKEEKRIGFDTRISYQHKVNYVNSYVAMQLSIVMFYFNINLLILKITS